MDNFAEYLVRKNETAQDKSKRTLTLIAGITLTLILATAGILMAVRPVLFVVLLLLAFASAYLTYFLVQSMYVEYEYTFTNGELDIDKIVAQKKRTSLLSVEIKKFDDFGKYSDEMEESEDMTVVFASDNIEKHEYYAEFLHDDYGRTRLVFSPDSKILDYTVNSLMSSVRNKYINNSSD